MRRDLTACIILVSAVLALYWPVRHHDFLWYDDPAFVTGNPVIQAGLTWASVRYACTCAVVGNWHPITTLSHALDCQLFGVNAGPQHLVNAIFHSLNAMLLFLLLRRMTGAFWRSAAVAALFALHPLRVESVAWLSERKDVLSAFFFFLTLLAYVRFVQRSEVRDQRSEVRSQRAEGGAPSSIIHHPSSILHAPHSTLWYTLALLLYALGLMSKPMLVTLPFVLLLLDYWPLGRIASQRPEVRGQRSEARGGSPPSIIHHPSSSIWYPPSSILHLPASRLLFEKIPFLLLSAVACVITLLVQKGSGAMMLMPRIGWGKQISNVFVSYVQYLGMLFWPTNLAAIYPHPGLHYPVSQPWPDWQVAAAALLLLAISALCLLQLRPRPYLAVGWFWFLGTLVPVIGLVQVGEQALADRYTYLPLIGPVLSLVWLVAEFPLRNTKHQTPNTKETPSSKPQTDARASTPPTGSEGRFRAWNLKFPWSLMFGVWCFALAVATRHQLRYWQNTVTLFEHNVEVTPDNPGAQLALGVGLEKQGLPERALVCYRVATTIFPYHRDAHYNLGQLLRKRKHYLAAATEYRAVLHSKPDNLASRLNLASTLADAGQTREAIQEFERVLQAAPDAIEALNNLAWIFAANRNSEVRDGARAVEYGERCCRLTQFQQTIMIGTLAAAYAEAGRFPDAVATAEKACAQAERNNETALLEKNRQLLDLYRAGKPYHEE